MHQILQHLPLSEGRALIYQKLLLSNNPKDILQFSQILKNSFKNNNLENAFKLELTIFRKNRST